MRKFLAPAVLACTFAFAPAAHAANEYTINYTTNPTSAGTSKKPVAFSGAFGFNVTATEAQGARPFALDAISVDFTGVRLNTRQFATCTAAAIERASSDAGCSSKSLVATGFANNLAGPINDRNPGAQLKCYLSIKLYNSGSGKMALFVRGTQNAPAGRQCAIDVATAIPVSVARRGSGDRLSFSIPQNLKNPIGTIRNALVETKLTLLKKTVRKSGRTVGFFEAVGGCRNGRRTVTVRFDNEGNNDT